jgi:hypothetical protein
MDTPEDPTQSFFNKDTNVVTPKIDCEYHPERRPANINLARRHGISKKIYQRNNEQIIKERCTCCGISLGPHDLIPMWSDLSAIYFLGSGYALYFAFFKHCVKLLSIFLIISGSLNLWDKYFRENILSDDEEEDFVVLWSISKNDDLSLQMLFNLISTVCALFYLRFMITDLREIEEEVNDSINTPADYTVQLFRLQNNNQNNESLWNKQSIKEWCENQALPGKIQIVSVIQAYDILKYSKWQNRLQNLNLQTQKTDKDVEEIEDLKTKISEIETDPDKNLKKLNTAFVILESQEMALFLIENNQNGTRSVWMNVIKDKVSSIINSLCKTNYGKYSQLNNVFVRRPPEPTEIDWINLSQTWISIFYRRTLVFVSVTATFIISFVIISAITYEEIQLESEDSNSIEISALSFLSSILLSILDPVIGLICLYLTKYELHATKTNFSRISASRISISKFINFTFTVITAKIYVYRSQITQIVESINNEEEEFQSLTPLALIFKLSFFGEGGILEVVFFGLAMNILVNIFFSFFDPIYFYKYFQQRKLDDPKASSDQMSQKEAHEFFEGPELDIETQYGTLTSTVLMTLFYSPGIPILLLLVICLLIPNYWSDKYIFLRRVALPRSLGSKIQIEMNRQIIYGPLLYASGSIIFFWIVNNAEFDQLIFSLNVNIFNCLLVYILLVFYTLGITTSEKKKLQTNLFFRSTPKYDEAKNSFLTNYDIENPVTKKSALINFVNTTISNKPEKMRSIHAKLSYKELPFQEQSSEKIKNSPYFMEKSKLNKPYMVVEMEIMSNKKMEISLFKSKNILWNQIMQSLYPITTEKYLCLFQNELQKQSITWNQRQTGFLISAEVLNQEWISIWKISHGGFDALKSKKTDEYAPPGQFCERWLQKVIDTNQEFVKITRSIITYSRREQQELLELI